MNAVWLGVTAVLSAAVVGLVLALKRRDPEIVGTPALSGPIDLTNPLVQRLRADLRELESMPLSSKEDLTRWYLAADSVREKLHQQYAAIYDQLPHELEHYLTDADTRRKDSSYAQYQKKLLRELLT